MTLFAPAGTALDRVGQFHVLRQQLPSYRFSAGDERRFHGQLVEAIEELLPGADLRHEWTLGAAGRIDFYLPELGLGIEVKVSGGPSAVGRQVARYLTAPAIERLLLVTARPHLGVLAGQFPADRFAVVRLLEGQL